VLHLAIDKEPQAAERDEVDGRTVGHRAADAEEGRRMSLGRHDEMAGGGCGEVDGVLWMADEVGEPAPLDGVEVQILRRLPSAIDDAAIDIEEQAVRPRGIEVPRRAFGSAQELVGFEDAIDRILFADGRDQIDRIRGQPLVTVCLDALGGGIFIGVVG
jgi:hypothetical protein